MKRKLTKKGQKHCDRILSFVRKYVARHDYAPSFEEIAQATGLLNAGHVSYYISYLCDVGLLENGPGKGRAIHLPDST